MKRSQKDRLLGHLCRRWISPLQALELVGSLACSQRVGDLRRDGHAIADRWLILPDGRRVKEYRCLRPNRHHPQRCRN